MIWRFRTSTIFVIIKRSYWKFSPAIRMQSFEPVRVKFEHSIRGVFLVLVTITVARHNATTACELHVSSTQIVWG